MAEGAFRATVETLGHADKFGRIDSCGTAGYHIGQPPDHRLFLSRANIQARALTPAI